MFAHQGTLERPNANRYRCINSALVNVLTKDQGGAILLMEDTNLQELKKKENRTDSKWIVWFSERSSNLRSQFAKKLTKRR